MLDDFRLISDFEVNSSQQLEILMVGLYRNVLLCQLGGCNSIVHSLLGCILYVKWNLLFLVLSSGLQIQ